MPLRSTFFSSSIFRSPTKSSPPETRDGATSPLITAVANVKSAYIFSTIGTENTVENTLSSTPTNDTSERESLDNAIQTLFDVLQTDVTEIQNSTKAIPIKKAEIKALIVTINQEFNRSCNSKEKTAITASATAHFNRKACDAVKFIKTKPNFAIAKSHFHTNIEPFMHLDFVQLSYVSNSKRSFGVELGTTYEKTFQYKTPEGESAVFGISKTPQHTTYVGEFHNKKAHGSGCVEYSNRTTYSGEFKESEKSGQGVMKFLNGDIYNGDFKDDTFNGRGTLLLSTEQYEGQFKDGKKHGSGMITTTSGNTISGTWNDGQRDGVFSISNKKEPQIEVWKKGIKTPEQIEPFDTTENVFHGN